MTTGNEFDVDDTANEIETEDMSAIFEVDGFQTTALAVTTGPAPVSNVQIDGDTISFAGEAGGRFVNLETAEYATPLRVLPLGDSITFGIVETPRDNNDNTLGGYRDDLFNLLTDSGVLVDYVGTRSTGPDALLDQDHLGISGIRADMIQQNLISQIAELDPDVVLLMAGTNDLRQNPDSAGRTTPQDLLGIIQIIINNNPDTQIFLSTLLPFEADNNGRNDAAQEALAEANQGIVQLVSDLNAAGFSNIHLVDNGSLPLEFISDIPADIGIHPTEEGFAQIAQRWFDALNQVFDATPNDLFGSRTNVDGAVQNIVGANGNDFLIGDARANEIDGQGGNDLLDGGAGNDTLTTGAGGDIVLASSGNDIITDLSSEDRIEFAEGDTYIGEVSFSGIAGQVRSIRSDGQTIIETDANGDGFADSTITLTNGEFVFGAQSIFGAVQLQINASATPPPPPPPPPPPELGDNLIVNGDFEDNGIIGDGFGFFTSIPGWVSTLGEFEIQEGANTLSDLGTAGNGVLELASTNNAGVQQTVTIIEGQSGVYELSFQYASRVDDASGALFDVVVDGVVVTTLSADVAGAVNTFNIDLDLEIGDHTIGFVERGQNDGRGTLLDNIALVFVSEDSVEPPSTGPLGLAPGSGPSQPILLVRDTEVTATANDDTFVFSSAVSSGSLNGGAVDKMVSAFADTGQVTPPPPVEPVYDFAGNSGFDIGDFDDPDLWYFDAV